MQAPLLRESLHENGRKQNQRSKEINSQLVSK